MQKSSRKIEGLLAIVFLMLASCAHSGSASYAVNSSNRGPASQTKLAQSSDQVIVVLETINSTPGFMFSRIKEIQIVSSSQVDLVLTSDEGLDSKVSFRTSQNSCVETYCPLIAEQIK